MRNGVVCMGKAIPLATRLGNHQLLEDIRRLKSRDPLSINCHAAVTFMLSVPNEPAAIRCGMKKRKGLWNEYTDYRSAKARP